MQDASSGSRRVPSEFHIVVVATSAGGLVALAGVLSPLPRDFPLPIAVVQHLNPNRPSLLAGLLARRTALQVKHAEQHDGLRPGVVIAQDEASSAFFGMPQADIEAGVVDQVLPLGAIAPAIADMLRSAMP